MSQSSNLYCSHPLSLSLGVWNRCASGHSAFLDHKKTDMEGCIPPQRPGFSVAWMKRQLMIANVLLSPTILKYYKYYLRG